MKTNLVVKTQIQIEIDGWLEFNQTEFKQIASNQIELEQNQKNNQESDFENNSLKKSEIPFEIDSETPVEKNLQIRLAPRIDNSEWPTSMKSLKRQLEQVKPLTGD